LLHAYLSTAALQLPAARAQTKLQPIAYLMRWHNNIFDYKLRTTEAKISQKVKNS